MPQLIRPTVSLTLLIVLISHLTAWAGAESHAQAFDIGPSLDACNVSWDVPGPTSSESMPVGNGDIGLNVWVEPSGDLAFYIGKTDSWAASSQDLMKVGGVHVAMNPSPLKAGAPFVQLLKLHQGEIEIREGSSESGVVLRVWVDANHPVIRVEAKSAQPVSFKVTLDDWRKGDIRPSQLSPDQPNTIVCYHRNAAVVPAAPMLANLTFGAAIKADGLVSKDSKTLESSAPATAQLISIFPLTATTDTPEAWLAQLAQQVTRIDTLDLETTRADHQKWWDAFWHRSWIFASGDKPATDVTEGYVLQRFVTACAGRGGYPIKFNGSIFVVDDPTRIDRKKNSPVPVDADYRTWGGQYWYQNTRAMYWPRLQAGDFDEMMPLFKMYEMEMKANEPVVKAYYGHAGSYVAEQQAFWAKLKYVGPEMPPNWNDHYFTDILDMGMMMLDYYQYTGNTQFAKQMAIPMISAGLTFFNEHFHRDANGKILLDPDNAIEMYWKARNPAPDIAGLRAILPRMIALPDELADSRSHAAWIKMQSELPELPTGVRNGKRLLLPYAGPQTMKSRNSENPELYAIYPFRLYGLEKPDLDLAIRTFFARKCKAKGCWVQDPIQAAMLGLTDVAEDYVHFNLTRKDPRLKFPAFWDHGNDYQPDEDNGGNGENGLQQMLLQAVGKKLLLFPAWPKQWDVDFKLHARYQTTVAGKFAHGKLVDLVVTPEARRADVIDMSLQTAATVPPPVFGQAGTVNTILSPSDPIVALKQTTKGNANVLASAGEADRIADIIDTKLDSKHLNRAQDADGYNPPGDNTGFVVKPSRSGVVTAVQFATGNDRPERDPIKITVEGSNDPNASAAQGNGFTLLYDGPTGLEADPGRKQWGPVIRFTNSKPYQFYRVLVTQTRGDSTDAVQYSEVRLGT
jgi:alpha-L-fucosidase 2